MIRIRLDEILKERNLTLTWLSEQTGIRYATLIDIKNSNVRVNLDYLSIIADFFGIEDMNELFEKEKDI